METVLQHLHPIVQGSGKKSKCVDGRVKCSERITAKYDGDYWATTWFMTQYWFAGLAYITFGGPIFAVTLFVQAVFFMLDPETLPGPITDDARFAGDDKVIQMWNWFAVYTGRLFMPYSWAVLGNFGFDYSDLNIRNQDADFASWTFLINWMMLPLTWVQSVLMLVLTSPVYLVMIPYGLVKLVMKLF